ncbi:PTS fructose-like transporter subunit IIB [Pectinatus sottacetonis]|uniref:PTS fructose-like transporter subunit IIB n=1 Tax=Pectinatus sottacetonis TaxID=1002795 RepID=UPI0018C4DB96|nr:PTS fructose-like transporter subunit IIB [Pectinatus sottacetonis]
MNILAVTACPSGVAHTYMAAEALKKAAEAKGHNIKVETQGSIGIENVIVEADVENADVVILTKDMPIKNEVRFKNNLLVRVAISDAVKKAPAIILKIEKHLANK